MPNYYLHLASSNEKALKNRSFVLGVEAPDMLKKHVKVYGEERAKAEYNFLKTDQMPPYDVFKSRIKQKEDGKRKSGLHYGHSSNPGVKEYWSRLTAEQKKNPFYRGYVWHLLTDAILYGRLNIEAKAAKIPKEDMAAEIKKLHDDWDRTNARVRDTYPEVSLTKEVKELGIVKFITEGEMAYVDWEIVKNTIDYLRKFDPLNGDMDEIIEKVLKEKDLAVLS